MWEDLMTDRPTTMRKAELRASLDWDLAPSQRASLFAKLFRRPAQPLATALARSSSAPGAAADESLRHAA